MNQRTNKRRRKNKEIIRKNVITRCSMLQRPVWEHEVCSKFILNTSSDSQNNCKNCKYSF